MNRSKIDLLLLLSAMIWGFAFVAQRAGMQFIAPFTYNAIRFALGGFFLIPFVNKKSSSNLLNKINIKSGIILGVVLFAGSSFQQFGIVYTTAGNAGFITGLYVILVPIIGLFVGRKTNMGTWLGALLAVTGMYLLNSSDDININYGNLLVFISAFFWAIHVLLIDQFTRRSDPLTIAVIQFLVTSLLCSIGMFTFEEPEMSGIFKASIPLIYGGLISVGIGFTLQIIAQKNAHPTHAAIILSLEAVFAVLGGILILHESLNSNTLLGCLLMLSGMILSQLWMRKVKKAI